MAGRKTLPKVRVRADHPDCHVRCPPLPPLPTTTAPAATAPGVGALRRAAHGAPRWQEAFGNAVVEAMACGVPVVAYQRGGPGKRLTMAPQGSWWNLTRWRR